jgi:hypothetical protein
MGTRHLRTLYEIHLAGNTVKAVCEECRHAKVFDAGRLWWLFHNRGWDQSLTALGEHLKCSECRGKKIEVRMSFDKPTGIQPSAPTDREWKDFVRGRRR